MKSTALTKADYITKFIEQLSLEIIRIKQRPRDYQSLFDRVSPTDIRGIYDWIIKNRLILDKLSIDNPIRFGAYQYNYPFPVTIQMTLGLKGIILHFDPNSKLARNKNSSTIVKKDPDVKQSDMPKKFLGQGMQKRVRKTWWLEADECYLIKNAPITDLSLPYNAYIRNHTFLYYYHTASNRLIHLKLPHIAVNSFDRTFELKEVTNFTKRKLTAKELMYIAELTNHFSPPSQIRKTAGNVVKGKENLKYFNRGKCIYEKIKHNPFILPMHYGTLYKGHGEDKEICKSVFYAPRAKTDLFTLIENTDKLTPDLADILWITFSMVYGVKKTHENGIILRDIKPENILVLENTNGICVYINDLDLGIEIEKAATEPEVGSMIYIAFDRPIFNGVLQAHNNALTDLKNFDIPHFSIEGCADEQQIIRHKKYKSILDSKSETVYQYYIKWYCNESVTQLKKSLKEPLIDFALSIIFNTLEPINCDNTPNHPKDDVWSMAVVLKQLLEEFLGRYDLDMEVPAILYDLTDIMDKTLLQQRAVRPDANELLLQVEKLIQNNMKIYATEDEEHYYTFKKFSSQLKSFNVNLRDDKTDKALLESAKQLLKTSIFTPTPVKTDLSKEAKIEKTIPLLQLPFSPRISRSSS